MRWKAIFIWGIGKETWGWVETSSDKKMKIAIGRLLSLWSKESTGRPLRDTIQKKNQWEVGLFSDEWTNKVLYSIIEMIVLCPFWAEDFYYVRKKWGGMGRQYRLIIINTIVEKSNEN